MKAMPDFGAPSTHPHIQVPWRWEGWKQGPWRGGGRRVGPKAPRSPFIRSLDIDGYDRWL